MSDQNTYINAYIDHAIGMIHEHINTILQLKTNLKVATDLIKQKDEVIATFDNKIKNAESGDSELNKSREDYSKLEQECNALRNKVSHFDSLVNQFNGLKDELTKKIQEYNDIKNELTRKNQENDDLKAKIEELSKPQQNVINTKNKASKPVRDKKETLKIEEDDDF